VEALSENSLVNEVVPSSRFDETWEGRRIKRKGMSESEEVKSKLTTRLALVTVFVLRNPSFLLRFPFSNLLDVAGGGVPSHLLSLEDEPSVLVAQRDLELVLLQNPGGRKEQGQRGRGGRGRKREGRTFIPGSSAMTEAEGEEGEEEVNLESLRRLDAEKSDPAKRMERDSLSYPFSFSSMDTGGNPAVEEAEKLSKREEGGCQREGEEAAG